MKCKIRGEKIKITEAIQEYTESKLSKLDKYFKDNIVEANILIRIRGNQQIIEVTIPYDKYTLRSEERQDDLYAAIDLVIDKLEGQIRKTKSKLKKQIKQNTEIINFDYEDSTEEVDELKKIIVELKSVGSESISEGVVFEKNQKSGILYMKKEGV